jgi:hypothetical protein
MGLRAPLLLKENVDGLLRSRGYHRKDLAQWCHKTEGWLSKIFRQPEREIPLKYLDRIADFFGLVTYQLFQPGIVRATERRKASDRRHRSERRAARRTDTLIETQTSQTRALPPVTGDISDTVLDDISAVAAKLTELSLMLADLRTKRSGRGHKKGNVS